jgi:phage-related holin
LQLSGTLSFFKQALSALFGTGTILNIMATPIIIIISNSMVDAASINDIQIPTAVSIALLAIAIWSIIVMAHIFSRVMSNPSFAMTAAFSYAVVNFIVQSSIASL